MHIPTWEEISDDDREMLKNLASSFGLKMEGNETVDGMVLPNEREAYSIALEMFTISRSVINRRLA